jgi:hypothetical protein
MKSIEDILKKSDSSKNTIFDHPWEVDDLTEYELFINQILEVIFDTKNIYCKGTIIDNYSAEIEIVYDKLVFAVKIRFDRLPCFFDYEPIITLLNHIIEHSVIGNTRYFTWAYDNYILLIDKNEYDELMNNEYIYIPHDTELCETNNRKYYKYKEIERNPQVLTKTIS